MIDAEEKALRVLELYAGAQGRAARKAELNALLADQELSRIDAGFASKLARKFSEELRFSPHFGWMTWMDNHWEPTTQEAVQSQHVTQLAEELVPLMPSEDEIDSVAATDEGKSEALRKLRKSVFSLFSTRAKAVRERAQGLASLLVSDMGAWDASLWTLNCPNGELDLRTGLLGPNRPDSLCTKLAGTHYDPAAQCPRWEAFVLDVMRGNQQLADFLQRMAGYLLTGAIKEHVFFHLQGGGRNGKGTFAETLKAAMGGYAKKCSNELLLESRQKPHISVTNNLRKLRFALFSELPEGSSYNESKIKDLTGGDTIESHHHYANEGFDFTPTHKLVLLSNPKPNIREGGQSFASRLRLIPFEQNYEALGRIDKDLPERLALELSGILAWAVRGCLEWQRTGLRCPDEVMEASREYMREQDWLGNFIRECVDETPVAISQGRTKSSELYKAYSEWAEAGGERPRGSKTFYSHLKKTYPDRFGEMGHGSFYVGLHVRAKCHD